MTEPEPRKKRGRKPKSDTPSLGFEMFPDVAEHLEALQRSVRHESRPPPTNYGGRVAAILEASKYRRRWDGRIIGYGTKWLP